MVRGIRTGSLSDLLIKWTSKTNESRLLKRSFLVKTHVIFITKKRSFVILILFEKLQLFLSIGTEVFKSNRYRGVLHILGGLA